MKIIVAGTRTFTDYGYLCKIIDYYTQNQKYFEIVSGCAKGVDSLAIRYAEERNIVLHKFPADWNTHGKRAGIFRNIELSEFADGLIAIWDNKSRGTKHMIDTMKKKNKPVKVVIYEN